jgi:hypothetical protein
MENSPFSIFQLTHHPRPGRKDIDFICSGWQLRLVMKILFLGLIPAAFVIVSCETMNQPISSSTFDPLSPPGSTLQLAGASGYGPALVPGSFVSATIENTAFYRQKPRGNADADKLLTRGTQMKIVSADATHAQVELDSGEVGYVPTVMVQAADLSPVPPISDGAYQVYPPLPDVGTLDPIPVIDPGGIPPEGGIPAIIDPEAPTPLSTVPLAIDPIPELTPAEPAADPTSDAPKESKDEEQKKEEAAE